MGYNSRVQIIPVKPKPRDKRVAIYARVSSNSVDQLNSLTAQKTGSNRKESNRLLADCKVNKINIVITKNISRFVRDSLEILSVLEQLKEINTRIIFETEELDTEKTGRFRLLNLLHRRKMSLEVIILSGETRSVPLMVHQNFTIDTMLSNDKYAGNVILFKKV